MEKRRSGLVVGPALSRACEGRSLSCGGRPCAWSAQRPGRLKDPVKIPEGCFFEILRGGVRFLRMPIRWPVSARSCRMRSTTCRKRRSGRSVWGGSIQVTKMLPPMTPCRHFSRWRLRKTSLSSASLRQATSVRIAPCPSKIMACRSRMLFPRHPNQSAGRPGMQKGYLRERSARPSPPPSSAPSARNGGAGARKGYRAGRQGESSAADLWRS